MAAIETSRREPIACRQKDARQEALRIRIWGPKSIGVAPATGGVLGGIWLVSNGFIGLGVFFALASVLIGSIACTIFDGWLQLDSKGIYMHYFIWGCCGIGWSEIRAMRYDRRGEAFWFRGENKALHVPGPRYWRGAAAAAGSDFVTERLRSIGVHPEKCFYTAYLFDRGQVRCHCSSRLRCSSEDRDQYVRSPENKQ